MICTWNENDGNYLEMEMKLNRNLQPNLTKKIEILQHLIQTWTTYLKHDVDDLAHDDYLQIKIEFETTHTFGTVLTDGIMNWFCIVCVIFIWTFLLITVLFNYNLNICIIITYLNPTLTAVMAMIPWGMLTAGYKKQNSFIHNLI